MYPRFGRLNIKEDRKKDVNCTKGVLTSLAKFSRPRPTKLKAPATLLQLVQVLDRRNFEVWRLPVAKIPKRKGLLLPYLEVLKSDIVPKTGWSTRGIMFPST